MVKGADRVRLGGVGCEREDARGKPSQHRAAQRVAPSRDASLCHASERRAFCRSARCLPRHRSALVGQVNQAQVNSEGQSY